MNRSLKVVLTVGVSIAVLMVLFPPFLITGGALFPAVSYSFFAHPPANPDPGDPESTVELGLGLLCLQLAFVLVPTLVAAAWCWLMPSRYSRQGHRP